MIAWMSLCQEVESLRNAATHDHPLRTEQVYQCGEPHSKIFGLLAQQGDAGRIAVADAVDHMASLDFFSGGQSAEKTVGISLRRLDRPISERGSRRKRLEAGRCPAGAKGAIHSHSEVADMAGHTAVAAHKAAIDHHAASDARADGHVDEMLQAPASAELPFPKGGRDAIIFEEDRQIEFGGERILKSEALPLWEGRDVNDCAR